MGCSASIPTTPFKDLTDSQKVMAKALAFQMIDAKVRAAIPSHAQIINEDDLWVEILVGGAPTRIPIPSDVVLAGEKRATRRATFHLREERGNLVLHTHWET